MDRERLINIAVIGAGNIATRHLENLVFLGGNRIAAICDLNEGPGTRQSRYIRGTGIHRLGKSL